MAFFGRYSLLLVLALIFVGSVAGPFSTETFAQDAADETVPYIADDEDEEEEAAASSITDDERAESNDGPTIVPGDSNASSDASTATAEPTGLMKLLNDNLQLIGGVICALVMLPILLKLARRKNPNAEVAAASMNQQATDLPISPPVDPLVIDEHQAFTDDGMVSPIEDLPIEDLRTEDLRTEDLPTNGDIVPQTDADQFVEQYAGSDVPPGAPNYPSIPNSPTTIIDDNSDTTPANSVVDSADFPYAGLKSKSANDELNVPTEDAVDMVGDDIEAVELADEPAADLQSIFDFEPNDASAKASAEAKAAAGSTDADIDEFEAANANDPFEVDEVEDVKTSPADELQLAASDVDEIELPEAAADDEEVAAAKNVTEEFADASIDEQAPPVNVPVVAAGAAAAGASAVAADTGIAEMRVAAVQEALSKEQQRVAKLNAEQDKLKKVVVQLEEQLAAAKKPSAASAAGSDELSEFDISAVVKLQDENRELSTQLTEEIARRQANDSQLKTLETSVKSLDARLSLVNTERDNLARMLYDAKQQAAAASRKPR